MSWDAFWAPNLVQWLVGAAITAIVGAVVGFIVRWWARRWLGAWLEQIFGETQETKALAQTAVDQSTLAAVKSVEAARDAGGARETSTGAQENSRQANQAVVWLADHVAELTRQLETANAGKEYLKDRANGLLGALAYEQAKNRPTDIDELFTDTGRHRLRTTSIPTQNRTSDDSDPADL